MAFLGPMLPDSTAQEIAEGDMDPMTQLRFDSLPLTVKSSDELKDPAIIMAAMKAVAATEDSTELVQPANQKQQNCDEQSPIELSFFQRRIQVALHLVAMALPLGIYCVMNHTL